ncbi:Juvenile hormone esterase [Pseudolycoriella hygida]|uniref:Carboxylic ester hydrolase n=1 Tax=Pseudolycoriella hygida TaxID=35572 RepID=A0A9Q0N1G3_9DIPT|nr:Juvenile hormone esterase [Pseudolycoriella hygida]
MNSTKITVKQGILCGKKELLPNGKPFSIFLGIPYAKPPVRELRFRSPQKIIQFDRFELDCTSEGDACFQKSPLTRKYVGSENCLNLNVYVPFQENPLNKLAVMVYIHGGAMKYDSNSRTLYSPEYLVMENVIVVVINYRLHALGFMYMPSMGISGNAGMKDQQMALEWIYENIESFGGNQQKICLFGESAGAACVNFHLLNAKSRKFINTMILQSGSAMCEWNFQGLAESTALELAKIVGCKGDSIEDAYNTLMTVPVKELYDNCDHVLTEEEENTGYRKKWRTVIEEESDDAFITQTSLDAIINQAGEFSIPIIIGGNNGDGMPLVARILSQKKLPLYDRLLAYFIPRSIQNLTYDEIEEIQREIRDFYFSGKALTNENVEHLMNLLTDAEYLFPLTVSSELHARYHPKMKQFLYEFQFDGQLNIQKKQMKMEKIKLASHADDVFYFFGGYLVDKVILQSDSREVKMRNILCKLWTNFAKYGDPTPDHDNPVPFKWTPLLPIEANQTEITLDYLVINDDMKMARNLNKERMDFWRKIYRKHNEKFIRSRL